jgi:sarcosine oxidase
VPLLRRAYELWRDLEKVAHEPLLHITGGIDAGAASSATITGSLQSCREHAIPHELMSGSDVNRRFPGYSLPLDMVAVYQPDGGFLMSERCVVAHVNAALAHGAEVHGRECVRGWDVTSGHVVVTTDYARYEAGSLVLTAGPWTPTIATDLARLVVAERQSTAVGSTSSPRIF